MVGALVGVGAGVGVRAGAGEGAGDGAEVDVSLREVFRRLMRSERRRRLMTLLCCWPMRLCNGSGARNQAKSAKSADIVRGDAPGAVAFAFDDDRFDGLEVVIEIGAEDDHDILAGGGVGEFGGVILGEDAAADDGSEVLAPLAEVFYPAVAGDRFAERGGGLVPGFGEFLAVEEAEPGDSRGDALFGGFGHLGVGVGGFGRILGGGGAWGHGGEGEERDNNQSEVRGAHGGNIEDLGLGSQWGTCIALDTGGAGDVGMGHGSF